MPISIDSFSALSSAGQQPVFHRLRLWLEEHVDPAQALRRTIVSLVARGTLAIMLAHQCLARIGMVGVVVDDLWLAPIFASLAVIDCASSSRNTRPAARSPVLSVFRRNHEPQLASTCPSCHIFTRWTFQKYRVQIRLLELGMHIVPALAGKASWRRVWRGRSDRHPFLRIGGGTAASCSLKPGGTFLLRFEGTRVSWTSLAELLPKLAAPDVCLGAATRCFDAGDHLQRRTMRHIPRPRIAVNTWLLTSATSQCMKGKAVCGYARGAQRFYEGAIGFNFRMWFSGIADVREW